MKKISKILLATISVGIVGILIFHEQLSIFNFPNIKTSVIRSEEVDSTLRIAACPSFHHLLDKLTEEENIITIKTSATGESLKLLSNKEVDFIISGRALKPNEPSLEYKILGHGYDFLFEQEIMITEDEMPSIKFFTDLPIAEITKDFPQIPQANIVKIDNIEKHLNQGIIITRLENEIKGDVAHIMQETGRRVALSRLPRLYYHSEVTNIFNENALFKLLTR
jgi:hypothetical protein